VPDSQSNNSIAYLNGDWKPLHDCQVPINTHALQYGTGCFEGIRAYWDGARMNLLFLREHARRLERNARMLLMTPPSVEEICAVIQRLVRDNAPGRNVYIRPLVYKKGTNLGPVLLNVPDGFLCYLQPLEDYLDTTKGLKLCVSSWRRLSDNALPTRTKATGGYLNSALAKSEAVMNGFDEAVFLNDRGQLCEGSAENIFLVRDGRLITPDVTADILEGINRAGIIGFAREFGIPVEERPVARTELYIADEVFLTGTGVQVAWASSIDHRAVGSGARGPITARMQQAFSDAVYGRSPRHASWLTPVSAAAAGA
jgi:branched-chain amino acid aminotransferase